MTERWYPSLEPCRLIYYSGSWYLIALQKGKLQVFPLADIKSVSLTSERFERRGHIHSLVAEERFISALPHFSFIHNLSTPLTCDRRPAKAVPTGMETIC
ncbi:putative DNA-binding protein [Escherichia coli]|uniref:Putative DNA-binding protein n=1 Tax=Escherichia coli TaxID=562 RepID=A0A376MMC6_ECOLX|nr:putative DNA-binding protein [Escherichia coli]